MTQAAQQNTQVSKYLEKIVAAVQEAVDSGESSLPWHSPYFLANLNRLVNPFRTKGFDGRDHPDGTPYSGMMNSLVLSMAAQTAAKRRNVTDNRFVPFSTMQELYKKGARILSNPCTKEKKDRLNDYVVVQIFFPKMVTKEVPTSDPEMERDTEDVSTIKIQVATGRYGLGRVVNVADTNLVEIGILPKLDSYVERDNPPIEELEKLIERFPHLKVEGMETPHYSPRTKTISTPPLSKARSSMYFYGTYCHELIHLVQDLVGEISGGDIDRYSEQELEAELGRCYILGTLGFTDIETDESRNSIAYVRGWLSRLSDDPEILLRASAKAKKFADWILAGSVPKSVVKNPERFPFLKDSPSLAA